MGKPIDDPLSDQCGNCAHHDTTGRTDGAGECCGVPSTPILIGSRPRQFGPGADLQLEMVRPIMAGNARPCALHKRRVAFDLMASRKGN